MYTCMPNYIMIVCLCVACMRLWNQHKTALRPFSTAALQQSPYKTIIIIVIFVAFFCCCCLWCRTKAIMQITKCLRTWIKYHEKRQKSLISSTRTFYDNDALHRTTCSDQKLAGWMPLFKTIFSLVHKVFMFARGMYCGKKLRAFVQSEDEKKQNQMSVSVTWFCFEDVLFQRKCTLCGVNRFYVEMRIFLCSSFILCHSDFPLCMLLDWKTKCRAFSEADFVKRMQLISWVTTELSASNLSCKWRLHLDTQSGNDNSFSTGNFAILHIEIVVLKNANEVSIFGWIFFPS